MVSKLLGHVEWSLQRDKDGHREYSIIWKVATSSSLDGPSVVLTTPGLPAIGSQWFFGNDIDGWAYCYPDATITPIITEEPNFHWIVEQKFSTKPLTRCQTTTVDNPINELRDISGDFQSIMREAIFDRFGVPFLSSSLEPLTGPALERDYNKATVRIKMNLPTLPLSSWMAAMNTVNDTSLWGLAPRTIKLSNIQWARKLYGVCFFYYTVTYLFDIDFSTHDTTVLDEGTRVLTTNGTKTNPTHFEQAKDANGENVKVLLNGAGRALTNSALPFSINVVFYNESNFLLLGVPPSLG